MTNLRSALADDEAKHNDADRKTMSQDFEADVALDLDTGMHQDAARSCWGSMILEEASALATDLYM